MGESLAVEIRSDYSDAEIEAECRFLGALMLESSTTALPMVGLSPHSFCEPFHRAIYYAVMLLSSKGRGATPAEVWGLVGNHPDADIFGFDHVVDLAVDAADPDRLVADYRQLLDRGFRAARRAIDFCAPHTP